MNIIINDKTKINKENEREKINKNNKTTISQKYHF